MLIDAFLFNDEVDMLEFRLKLLWDYVDLFVIVESDHTFSGKPKPLHYSTDENLVRFLWAREKLSRVYHKSDPSKLKLGAPPDKYAPTHDCWKIEHSQREAIVSSLHCFPDETFVLMGDVDEIPSREALEMMKKDNFSGIATFQQFFFYYNLHTLRDEMWPGTIWCPVKALRKFGAQALRDSRGNTGFNIDRGGWHLSYFGGNEAIRNKIESFSHQELNKPEFTEIDKIAGRVAKGADLFDRGVTSRKPPVEFFPEYFLENMPEGWL